MLRKKKKCEFKEDKSMEISNQLKCYRKKNNYTQEYVANCLNISRQAISAWENSSACPDLENLILLSQLYEISLDDLVINEVKSENKKELNDSTVATKMEQNELEIMTYKLDSICCLSIVMVASQLRFLGIFLAIYALKNMKKNSLYKIPIIFLCIICVAHFLDFCVNIVL